MSKILNLIKTEPAMITAVAQTVLGVIVSIGLNVSADETGAILAVTTAVLALITGASARPFNPSFLTGLVTAVVTLLLAFGVNGIQPGLVSSLNAAIVAVTALVLRGHITPVATLNARAKAVQASKAAAQARTAGL